MANFAFMSGTGNDFLVGTYEGPVSEIQIIALVSDAEYEVDGVIFVEPINEEIVKITPNFSNKKRILDFNNSNNNTNNNSIF